MKKRNLLSLVIGALLVVTVMITALYAQGGLGAIGLNPNSNNNTNQNNNDSDSNPDDPGANQNDPVKNAPKLICFDFIDKSLQEDGFTYLEGTIWGRGPKNQFIFDVGRLEFSWRDHRNAHMVTDDWYKTDYIRHLEQRYVHSLKELQFMPQSIDGPYETTFPQKEKELSDPKHMHYDLIPWMNYYINKFKNAGCSIEGLDVDKLQIDYKKTVSTATQEDVVSVFDRKSKDGFLRYFADAHQPGNIEDHPRYREIKNFEDYDSLDMNNDWEQMYFFVLMYKNYSGRTFDESYGWTQGIVLREFVKDILFEYTVWNQEIKNTPTLGAYFIYVDNPNKEFQYLYKPTPGEGFSQDLRTFRFPFEAQMLHVNVDDVKKRFITPYDNGNFMDQMRLTIDMLKLVNPDVRFADDFLTHYSRPFNLEWQRRMGLTELFKEKYNFVVEDIKYHN